MNFFTVCVSLEPMDSLELIAGALRLERAPFIALLSTPNHLSTSLLVVFLAGLSQSLGQSLVLFANRIKPRHFVLSLLASAVIYVFGFLFSVASIWLTAKLIFDKTQHFWLVTGVVGLTFAPYLFGFFILTPYLGLAFGRILSLWRLAALLIALEVTLFFNIWQALACSVLSWLLLEVLEHTLGLPIQQLSISARRFAAGRKLEDVQTLFLKRDARLWRKRRLPKRPK
jgi:hypothetical protein